MPLRRLLALFAAAVLILAACGDDDGDEAADDTTTTTAASDEDDATTTTEADTTTSEDVAEETTTTAGDDAGQALGDLDFSGIDDICELARAGDEVGATAFDDIDPTLTAPEDLESVFVAADDFLARAAEIAPSEIQEDMQVVSDAFGGLIDVLAEFDYDFFALALQAENDPELISQLEALDDPRLEEASANIEAYFQEECGIEPEPEPAG